MSNPTPTSPLIKWLGLLVLVGIAASVWWIYKPAGTTDLTSLTPPTPAKGAVGSVGLATKPSIGSLTERKAWSSLPGAKAQAPATNFTEALKAYSPYDQQYLKQFNSLTFGLLDFSSPEDQQWKVVRGYPTIEEVLASRGKPPSLEVKFYREAPLKEAVAAALKLAEKVQETKSGTTNSLESLQAAQALVFLVAGRVGEENPQSASLSGYLYALVEPPNQNSGSVSALISGASLAAQFGDPVLAFRLSEDLRSYETLKARGIPGELTSIYSNGITVRRWQTDAGVYSGRPFKID